MSLVLLIAAGLGSGSDRSRGRAPMLVVKGYVESFNRGDTAGALAALGPDAVQTHQVIEHRAGDRNVTPHISPEAQKVYQFAAEHGIDPNAIGPLVRGGSTVETAPAITPQLTFTDPRVEGDTVTAAFILASPEFSGGVQRVIGITTAVVRNQKIVLLSMDWDATDPQTVTALNAWNPR